MLLHPIRNSVPRLVRGFFACWIMDRLMPRHRRAEPQNIGGPVRRGRVARLRLAGVTGFEQPLRGQLDARKPANCVIFKKAQSMEERLCRKEGLSMVLSLYLRSTLGIIFFQSLDKFGGAFEEPFVRLVDRTWPMRR